MAQIVALTEKFISTFSYCKEMILSSLQGAFDINLLTCHLGTMKPFSQFVF